MLTKHVVNPVWDELFWASSFAIQLFLQHLISLWQLLYKMCISNKSSFSLKTQSPHDQNHKNDMVIAINAVYDACILIESNRSFWHYIKIHYSFVCVICRKMLKQAYKTAHYLLLWLVTTTECKWYHTNSENKSINSFSDRASGIIHSCHGTWTPNHKNVTVKHQQEQTFGTEPFYAWLFYTHSLFLVMLMMITVRIIPWAKCDYYY